MKKSSRIITATLGIICIILTATLTGTIIQYNSTIDVKELTIDNLQHQLEQKNNTISSLNLEITNRNSQIENITNEKDQVQNWLNNNITLFKIQIEELQKQNSTNQQTITRLQKQNSTNQQTITRLQNLNSTNQQTIINLQNLLETSTQQTIDLLTVNITELENQTDYLKSVLFFNTSDLQTLVFQISQKDWIEPIDINYTYNKILDHNNDTFDIVILPEFEDHQNWIAELEWLNDNFRGKQGIPIMLDAFSSSEGDAPIIKRSPEEIRTALTKCNIEYVRFAEVISWHMERHLPFPTEYVLSMFKFCRANDLNIFWTEWKTDYDPEEVEGAVEVFTFIETLIEGYEDIVTVSFSTNSGEAEPVIGFLTLNEMFQHWGASIQPWYWNTSYNEDLQNMPIDLLIKHTWVAESIGAEIIQFEPYWYFFNPENGEITENLEFLFKMLK